MADERKIKDHKKLNLNRENMKNATFKNDLIGVLNHNL